MSLSDITHNAQPWSNFRCIILSCSRILLVYYLVCKVRDFTGKFTCYRVRTSCRVQQRTAAENNSFELCQCHLQTTSSLCQSRSCRRASPSSQQLSFAGFFCGRPCDMKWVIRQSERSGHQQRLLQAFTGDVFIFSLLLYIAY